MENVLWLVAREIGYIDYVSYVETNHFLFAKVRLPSLIIGILFSTQEIHF
jgi:hypothetical protein